MMATRHAILVLVVVISAVHGSDQVAYEALIARIDRLEGKVDFLEHTVSTMEAKATSQQGLISEQQSTISRQQTSIRDVFVKYGKLNTILSNRVQHLERIIASNVKMTENTARNQDSNTEEDQKSEVGQERPESGSPKLNERSNHSKSRPSISQVPGRTDLTGKPTVAWGHGQDTEHAKRLVLAASVGDGPVAFMARMDTDKSNVGVNQDFVFETVLMNIGDGYHNLQGVFIAPTAGLYMFSSTLTSSTTNQHMDAEIVHNGNSVCRIFAADTTTWEQSGQTALIQLAQGDEVWVRNLVRDHTNVHGGRGYSTFTGYLIWRM